MFAQPSLAAPEIAAALGRSPSTGLTRRLMLGALATGIGSAMYPQLAALKIQAASEPFRQVDDAIPATPAASAKTSEYRFPIPAAAELRDWSEFRARFIRADGRVVDTYNKGVSHTESQGVGMLFAVTYDDRRTFDRIWDWTRSTLSRPSDTLLSWRYDPNSRYPVSDMNNATDGDIYIAGALARAARRWGSKAYAEAARRMADDILNLLTMDVGARTLLLPAAEGFVKPGHILVNPSYYVFPLMEELREISDRARWGKLIVDGRALVREARFGEQDLPSDWIRIDLENGGIGMPADLPSRFSFDAVRVALFMRWDRANGSDLLRFRKFWGRSPSLASAWIDLQTGVRAPFTTCGGVVAIATVVKGAQRAATERAIPSIRHTDEYYSAALTLLSRMACRETDNAAAAV